MALVFGESGSGYSILRVAFGYLRQGIVPMLVCSDRFPQATGT